MVKTFLRRAKGALYNRAVVLALALNIYTTLMGAMAWKTLNEDEIELSAAGFYSVRAIRLAYTDAVALDRVLDYATAPNLGAETHDALEVIADQFYVRFQSIRMATSGPLHPESARFLDLANAVQNKFDGILLKDHTPTVGELAELRRLNEALVRAIGDHIRNIEATTDEALLRREQEYSSKRYQVIGGFGLLSLMSIAVIILLDRHKRASRQAKETLLRDPLTGLFNRHGLTERFAEIERSTGVPYALIVFDLDDFKPVNDTYGHAAGDQFLVAAGAWLRDVFGSDGIVARWGGDEFIAVLPALGPTLDDCVRRLRARLSDTPRFNFERGQARLSFSCGVAVWPRDAGTIADALQKADFALYAAKEQGKGRLVVYDPSIIEKRRRFDDVRKTILNAIDNGDLLLYWQPQVDLRTGRTIGAEALIRCRDPRTGRLVMPGEFIPVAERSDLILEIDRFVLDDACRSASGWAAKGAGDLRASINISPRMFLVPGLASRVSETLTRHGLPADRLEIEITEGILLESNEVVHRNLVELGHLGVQIALDDFGTGYSNISYLMTLKPDVIKIDRSFLNDEDHETRNKVIGGILDLARSIGAETIVEGVETPEQLRFLQELGCPFGQGYLFARPMSGDDLLPWRADFEARQSVTAPRRLARA